MSLWALCVVRMPFASYHHCPNISYAPASWLESRQDRHVTSLRQYRYGICHAVVVHVLRRMPSLHQLKSLCGDSTSRATICLAHRTSLDRTHGWFCAKYAVHSMARTRSSWTASLKDAARNRAVHPRAGEDPGTRPISCSVQSSAVASQYLQYACGLWLC